MEHSARLDYVESLRWYGLDKEADRVADCRVKHLPFGCGGCGAKFAFLFRCKTRGCPSCARVYAIRVADKYEYLIKAMKHHNRFKKGWTLKVLTVTLAHNGTVRERVDRIHAAFTQLWKEVYKPYRECGAIASLEIATIEHVHLHILFYGPYINQKHISKVWKEITGDSDNVWIEAVKGDVRRQVEYITKYIAKGLEDTDPSLLASKIVALQGKRRYWTKGVFYHPPILCRPWSACPCCGECNIFFYRPTVDEKPVIDAVPLWWVEFEWKGPP